MQVAAGSMPYVGDVAFTMGMTLGERATVLHLGLSIEAFRNSAEFNQFLGLHPLFKINLVLLLQCVCLAHVST